MDFQKGDCFGPPEPLAVVVLAIALVLAALAVRLWRQGFVLHAAFAILVPPDYAAAMLLEMVATGMIQLLFLACWLVREHMRTELTPTRIRLRAPTVPPRERGYSAPTASSA